MVSDTMLPEREPGRVRLGTLNMLRWLAVAGQSVAIGVVYVVLGFDLPLALCLVCIVASAALNLVLHFTYPAGKRLSDTQVSALLAYDQVQLAALLYLTGGLENPFALLFIAPVAVFASSLSLKHTVGLGLLSLLLMTGLALDHYPLPWEGGRMPELPPLYIAGVWIALVLGFGFTAVVSFRVASEAARMSAALSAAQLALAREQRLSALGALAAATAHELGSPLGTIAVVAKELARALPKEGALADDAALLQSQVERCREILRRLAQPDDAQEAYPVRAPLLAVLEEIAAPYRGGGVEIDVQGKGEGNCLVRRRPELLHGIANLVENAADFASTGVRLDARWTKDRIELDLCDDGPGFPADILDRLGEPYVTTRGRNSAPSQGEFEGMEGLGLGFFIAKTLLERTGATLVFGNAPAGGAVVRLSWPRAALDSANPKSAA